ncbi:MAG: hypothetical protein NVS3B12_21420 [Acidimicrobiales bacterium]
MARTQERTRSSADAVADLIDALASVGVEASAGQGGDADLVVRLVDGGTLLFDVKPLTAPSPREVATLTARTRPAHDPVVVADRLVPASRRELNQANWGWLDRRGHLRLRSGSLIVDTEVPGIETSSDRSRPVLETDVGLDVACALLAFADPEHRMSVRQAVGITGRSLAAVHAALTGLRAAGLADGLGSPLIPDLFWEVSPRWRPRRAPLGGLPQPGDAARTHQLELGFDHVEETEGWAMCDTVAANAYGAAAVVGGAYPPDFYAPSERTVRVARQLYGEATYDTRQATVAVPAVAWACRRRVDTTRLERDHPGANWPAVHPVFVALDLAVDPSRGREILDGWSPPEPFRRVW